MLLVDEKEICDLEAAFSTFCGSKLRKITRSKFRNRFENFLPTAVIDGLFNVFDENGDNEIMFKEFVCGSSALFNGPENARLTCKLHELISVNLPISIF